MRGHRSWLEIDLDAFRHNLRVVRELAGSAATWPVLKANAYGHGAPQIAQVCAEEGISRIGVGDSREALELRAAGIELPLLILGTVIDAEVDALLQHDVEVGVHSESRTLLLGEAARRTGRLLGVHLKVDTGMGRLGVRPPAALRVAQAIASEPWLELRGVMTHFAARDGFRDPSARAQAQVFQEVLAELRAHHIQPGCVHFANSTAIFTGQNPLGDAVRPGIALYGMLPQDFPHTERLRPVLSLQAQVVFLKDIPAGTTVGYGGRWRASRPTRLATLPLGYHDGIPFRLGAEGRGEALLHGQRCPVVGAVSMDYLTLDVGHVPGVTVGDPATLIGQDGNQCLRVEDVAAAAGTIPYEITCSIGSRVARVMRKESPAPSTEHSRN